VWTLHVCRSNVKLQYAAMSMSQDDTRTMKHAGKWSKAYDTRIRSLIGSGYQCFRVDPKSFTFSVSISTCNVAAQYSDNEARQKMEEKCFAYGARNLQDCYITEGWRLDRPKTGSDRIQILLYSLLLGTSIHSDTIRILDTETPTFFYLTLWVESIHPAPKVFTTWWPFCTIAGLCYLFPLDSECLGTHLCRLHKNDDLHRVHGMVRYLISHLRVRWLIRSLLGTQPMPIWRTSLDFTFYHISRT
jgi:hypothetical protein